MEEALAVGESARESVRLAPSRTPLYRRRYYLANKDRVLAKARLQYERHRLKRIEYAKQYRINNPERVRVNKRNWEIKKRYGLSPEQVDALRSAQNNSCAICRRVVTLVIDHDHSTGQVRGLICNVCNGFLGAIGDRRAAVYGMAAYLEVAQCR